MTTEELILTEADYKQAAGRLFAFKKREGFAPAALHLYRQPDSSILYARVRMHKPAADGGHEKFVRPFWHDGAEWKHGEPKQERGKVLYGLADIDAAPDMMIFVVEGEQKADALTRIGADHFAAVTSGSATSAGGADWLPLTSRSVVLWPDNDAPGQRYADEVAARLEPLGCSVSRIDVAALALPEGGDVMDWLDALGHEATASEVLALPVIDSEVIDAPPPEQPASGRVEPSEDDPDAAEVARLAALNPMQYDRERRDAARRLKIRPATLDAMVKEARGEAEADDDSPFDEVEPWHAPVDGAALLDALVATVHRFIVCEPATAHAAALWISMTWVMDSVDVAPIAAITAPEKRCGKSQLLFLMGRLSCRPLTASNITPAALFRAIEVWSPTLLIDEADAFMRENEELRGLLNCGHTRDSAFVIRTVGDDHTPRQFRVWGAKAIAGIGHLADTLMDRAVTLELRRKLPHESVDKLRHAEAGLFDTLRAKLARWAEDNGDAVRAARPSLPDALHDRASDNWEALAQIADTAGGAWPEIARRAALVLSGSEELSQSGGAELLADVQEVFETRGVERIFSADLLDALFADEEKPWATWNRGRPMSPRQLAKKLAEYGIGSAQIRIGYESKKGYRLSQFSDAFARYLHAPADFPVPSETTKQPNAGAASSVSGVFRDSDASETRNMSETLEPLSDKGCFGVSDEVGESAKNTDANDDAEAV